MLGLGNSLILNNALKSDGNVPVNTIAPVISGTALVGNTLTSTTGTWTSDTGVIGYLYQWYRGTTLISSATNSTYVLTFADGGFDITCRVAATDTDGTSAYVSSNSINLPLLLDTYTNATVAYSLRKLRTAYVGSAIRVRRASDNTETNIGFVNNELDTATLASFCSGTNGFVTTWYDQSGNGNNLTQTNATNQPQIVLSGSVILQGSKPTLKTDGNDWLETTALNIYASTTNLSSFQVVTELTNTTANDFVFGVTSNNYGNSDNSIILRKNSNEFNAIVNNGTINATASHLRDTNQNLLSFIYRGGVNLTFWKNSATNVNNTVASSVNPTKELEVASGLNATLAGEWNLQEKIDWKTDQTTNALAIRQNIANYYGITL